MSFAEEMEKKKQQQIYGSKTDSKNIVIALWVSVNSFFFVFASYCSVCLIVIGGWCGKQKQ